MGIRISLQLHTLLNFGMLILAIGLLQLLLPHPWVAAECQFPDYLLLPSTNTWLSRGLTRSASSSMTQFSQLSLRGDLQRLIITYPVQPNRQDSRQRPFNLRFATENNPNPNETSVVVNMRCDKIVEASSGTYIAEILMSNSRSVYICLRFRGLSTGETTEVFELLQGESSPTAKEIHDCLAVDAAFHRSIWIPSPDKYLASVRSGHRCPLAGGFQAKNFVDLSTSKTICDSAVYVTIDSECIRGEGMEFHFNDATCNPFESSLVTKMECFVQWSAHGNTNAILVDRREDGHYIFASLLYHEAPLPADTMNNAYGPFTMLYLGLGVYYPVPYSNNNSLEGNGAPFPAYLYDLLGLLGGTKGVAASGTKDPGPYARGAKNNNNNNYRLHQPNAPVYEVWLRGAFGVCDDELEQCEKGCNADTRNRLFCRRTCPSVRKECSMEHRDSCEIAPSYHGLWHLIDAQPRPRDQSTQVNAESANRHLKKLINISDRTVSFADVLGYETYYEFSCLREASEIVTDWYILGGRHLRPGCHPRDVCLEVYQNRPIFSNEGPNTNTLQYKISKSQRQGVDIPTLCSFPSEKNSILQQRPQLLIKQPSYIGGAEAPHGGIHAPSKCELYQIKLKGTISFHIHLYSLLLAQLDSSMHLAKNLYYGQPFGGGIRDSTPFTWNRVHQPGDLPHIPEVVSCSIELSDFNPNLGTTGEFDGNIRFKSGCTLDILSRFSKSDHRCISVYNMDKGFKYTKRFLMLVTYSEFANSFFCWIIQESEVEGKTVFQIHVFLTPQCQYEETALGDIYINKSAAIAIMHVATEKSPCLNCEQNTQPEAAKPPKFQKFRHLFKDVSITHSPTSCAPTTRQRLWHLLTTTLIIIVLRCMPPTLI